VKKRKFNVDKLDDLPKWNVAALLAYMIGASSKWWLVQDLIVSSLAGLLVSIVAYLALYYGASMLRVKLGHSRLSD
jgi:hypothetical protein